MAISNRHPRTQSTIGRVHSSLMIILVLGVLIVILFWLMFLNGNDSDIVNDLSDNAFDTSASLELKNIEDDVYGALGKESQSIPINDDKNENIGTYKSIGAFEKSEDNTSKNDSALQGRAYVFGNLTKGVKITAYWEGKKTAHNQQGHEMVSI